MKDSDKIIIGDKFVRTERIFEYSHGGYVGLDDREVVVVSISKSGCDTNYEFSHIKSSYMSYLEICTASSKKITDYLEEIKQKLVEPKPRLSYCE